VQSALATAITIGSGGITKASPGVMTYTGTDPSDGDILLLTNIVGMHEVGDRLFRADNTNAGSNTTELEGEDTSSYTTITSGQAQVVTFGYSIGDITLNLNASGGEFEQIDMTPVSSRTRVKIPGVASEIQFSFSLLWDPSNAALAAMAAASKTKSKLALEVRFADGARVYFYGYVACLNVPTGSSQEAAVTTVTFTGVGYPTAYAS
jgi:hypothetical protein